MSAPHLNPSAQPAASGGTPAATGSGLTPAMMGYAMPPEWAEHSGTWLSWPKNPLTFPPRVLPAVEDLYTRMAVALSQHEVANILVEDEAMEGRVHKRLEAAGAREAGVRLHRIPSCDVWIRDYGPTFLLHKKLGHKACVKWRFNAWGGKYDDILGDDETGERVVEAADVKAFRPGVVMEGGSIDADGAGRLLTTRQCLLNKNRNPDLGQARIEQVLRDSLGVEDVIWLHSGIEGDDTDGHVDDFARFFAPGKALCNHSADEADPNTAVLRRNEDILRSRGDIEVVRLPMPKPLVDEEEGRRLPASYANFYVANKTVLLPVFGDEKDEEAIGILASCFPGREVVALPARELVFGYGGVHCVTQQEPKARE